MTSSEERLDALLQALGRVVMASRIEHKWTRKDLASKSGVSERQVGKIERGERGQLVEVWRVADALGIKLSEATRRAESQVDRDRLSEAVTERLRQQFQGAPEEMDREAVMQIFREIRLEMDLEEVEAVVFRDPFSSGPLPPPERPIWRTKEEIARAREAVESGRAATLGDAIAALDDESIVGEQESHHES